MPKKQPTTERSQAPETWLKAQDQRSLLVTVSSALVLTVCYWWFHGGHQGQLIEIERASPLQARFLVDINRADWPEIIQLPGIGELLAQRVLAERRNNGPFRNVDELVRVDGIGVKTLERLRPYLLPIAKESDWSASETNDSLRVE